MAAAPFVYCLSSADASSSSEDALLMAARDGDLYGIKDMTQFMCSALCGGTTVKYFLDHGGDLLKADEKKFTVLHHTVCSGSCKVTEFLLSKGIPVNIDHGHGTPLCMLLSVRDKMVHILLVHANFGRLPIDAALRDCREEVELLFPVTSPIQNLPNWSIDGVLSHAKFSSAKPMNESQIKERKALLRSQENKAFGRKDYDVSSKLYGLMARCKQQKSQHGVEIS